MSAGVGGGGHSGRGAAQDFELNLASIIDCFTVLITFLLATASFLSIGIFDAGVAAAGAQANTTEPPPINLAIELKKDFTIEIKVQGKENKTYTITHTQAGAWDYPALTAQLEDVKKRWPTVAATTLQAEDLVEYKELVKTMEVTKKSLSAVLLGGF